MMILTYGFVFVLSLICVSSFSLTSFFGQEKSITVSQSKEVVFSSSLGLYDTQVFSKLKEQGFFNKLKEDQSIGIEIYGVNWGDLKRSYIVSGEGVFDGSGGDVTIGVKESFLQIVNEVNDFCLFVKDLPVHSNDYRITKNINIFYLMWKYDVYSLDGAYNHFCG